MNSLICNPHVIINPQKGKKNKARRLKTKQKNEKTNEKVDLILNIVIITLNVNYLNTLNKRWRFGRMNFFK